MSTDAEKCVSDAKKAQDTLVQLVRQHEQTIMEQRQELLSARVTIDDLRADLAEESLKKDRLKEHLRNIKEAEIEANCEED